MAAKSKRETSKENEGAASAQEKSSAKIADRRSSRTSAKADDPGAPKAKGGRRQNGAAPESVGETGHNADKAKAKRPRRQQRRAIETKQAILGAALQEFAKKGFDAASMRDIADRLGIQHPLITYHFRTKELLWRAVAEQIMNEIQEEMKARTRDVVDVKPIDKVRAEFRALLSIQFKYPHFHHFMLNESRENSPRLRWLAKNVLAPIVNSLLPEIRRAQAMGDLPAGEPVLLHYMLVGMTSILVSVASEIEAVTGFQIDAPGVADDYFTLIDRIMFGRDAGD